MRRFSLDPGPARAGTTAAPRWAAILLVGLLGFAGAAHAQIQNGVASITFWEVSVTGGPPTANVLGVSDPRMCMKLPNPLSATSHHAISGNNDFVGVPGGEFYDVFYSDRNGTPTGCRGECITVEAVWNLRAPSGGGLNIAEVELTYQDGSTSYLCEVAGAVYFGDNLVAGSADLAADGRLDTYSVMGNTVQPGAPTRLRITLCSPCAGQEADNCKNIRGCNGKVASETTDRYNTVTVCADTLLHAQAAAESQAFAAMQTEINDACDGLRCGEQTCKSGKPRVCQLNKKQEKPSVECIACQQSPTARCASPVFGLPQTAWDCVVRETFEFACECKCEIASLPD